MCKWSIKILMYLRETTTSKKYCSCGMFYPAMTAFTDQYSLRNIFFDIGQL